MTMRTMRDDAILESQRASRSDTKLFGQITKLCGDLLGATKT
jgi:hypothetical protein